MTNVQARLISLALLAIGASILVVSSGAPTLVGGVILFGCVWMYVYEYMYSGKVETLNETRCRKCNYILRGISEPRCPECGEKI
jgi:hypothetical protein